MLAGTAAGADPDTFADDPDLGPTVSESLRSACQLALQAATAPGSDLASVVDHWTKLSETCRACRACRAYRLDTDGAVRLRFLDTQIAPLAPVLQYEVLRVIGKKLAGSFAVSGLIRKLHSALPRPRRAELALS